MEEVKTGEAIENPENNTVADIQEEKVKAVFAEHQLVLKPIEKVSF